eukprot:1175136-Alexandrium_andersonii.AAC.1
MEGCQPDSQPPTCLLERQGESPRSGTEERHPCQPGDADRAKREQSEDLNGQPQETQNLDEVRIFRTGGGARER